MQVLGDAIVRKYGKLMAPGPGKGKINHLVFFSGQ